jgi:predicted DNA-binding protein (UPF0251 family)
MTVYSYQSGGDSHKWLFDPQTVDSIGPILSKLITYDVYFAEEEGVTTLQIVLDKILDELPPELEEAVRLTYLAGISYRSAGKTIGVDHKTVKARADKGITQLRKRLTDTVWLATLIRNMIPEDEDILRVSSPERMLNVLDGLSNIRSSND